MAALDAKQENTVDDLYGVSKPEDNPRIVERGIREGTGVPGRSVIHPTA